MAAQYPEITVAPVTPAVSLDEVIQLLERNFPGGDFQLVQRAHAFAERAHAGQMRASGEPYITHSLHVARNLAALGLDPVTCAAGLLHDVLEDTGVTREELALRFGEEIAWLVDGVTKISGLEFHHDPQSLEQKQVQNIRKMLVATARDLRVIFIKLADRLHNIRTLEYLPEEKRRRIARETLDIFAPLAHRLGISEWRWELEDYAFRHLDPAMYRELARMVAMKRREREAYLQETVQLVRTRLEEAGLSAEVIGRPKHLYSIYEKMLRQGKEFNEVMDVLGIRVITRTERECYEALGIIHNLWTPIPGRLKDYIAMPKMNMYQTLHTTVMRENGLAMEVQIRTEAMDRVAREGLAAHWRYKEGSADEKLDAQIAWLRRMYDWIKDAGTADGMLDSMRREFQSSFIYVFTPKGEVKELPRGATPLDFAYLVHSHVGHHCIGARVNGKMVPLRYNLQTGDQVEILTSKHQEPRLDWLDMVVTGRARVRIRQRLRELGELPPLEEVRPAEKEARTRPELPSAPQPRAGERRVTDDATRRKLIRVGGVKGMAVQFAKCCDPMPGDQIVGYVTRTPGISIHRRDCRSFQRTARDPRRIVDASWEGEGNFMAWLRVETRHRPNLLADITDALRPLNLDIRNASFTECQDGTRRHYFDFSFETSDHRTVEQALRVVRTVPGVLSARPLDAHGVKGTLPAHRTSPPSHGGAQAL